MYVLQGELNNGILKQWLALAWAAILSTICYHSSQSWLGWLQSKSVTQNPQDIYR